MIALIRGGVAGRAGVWADLGAGTGNFTWALRELLGASATIYAIDRDAKAIRRQRELLEGAGEGARIVTIQADFTRQLELPALDGVLMANALHFVRDQPAALALVSGYLRRDISGAGAAAGRVLLIEYDLRAPIPWVPFPVPFERFAALAAGAGLGPAVKLGSRVSPSSGIAMYAAVAEMFDANAAV